MSNGVTWSPDGNSIVFSSGDPLKLFEVSTQGGNPKLLFEPEESEKDHGFLQLHFLPHEGVTRGLLFRRGEPQGSQIVVLDLETGRREVLAAGARPVYSPTGHIVYEARDENIWALPFSLETLKAAGEPFHIHDNASLASVARDGTLVYLDEDQGGLMQLIWRDRAGRKLETIGQPQERIQMPDLSADAGRVTVRAWEDNNPDIWVHDVARGFRSRITSLSSR